MRLLRLGIERHRWDLAAHALVLAAVHMLDRGERPRAGRIKGKRNDRQQGR